MIRYLSHKNYGRSQLGWLDSHFHFSFADYYCKDNMNFGILRVLNDDIVQPNTGFDTHPHQDMEIISYAVKGELTHGDSMGNKKTLTRGQVQYMSAGTGVLHSEHNLGQNLLRFLQIWIYPDAEGYQPNYGDYMFDWEQRINQWMPIASGDGNQLFPIQIHADVHVYSTYLKKDNQIEFDIPKGRQAYMVLIEGTLKVQDILMEERDALEIQEEKIALNSETDAHVLIIEMKKEEKRL